MKSIALIICCALLCFAHVQAQSSTAGENEQAYREYVSADKEMNRIYQQQLKAAGETYLKVNAAGKPYNEVRAALMVAQKAFLAYRAKEGEYVKATHEQGAATPYYMYNTMKKLTEERIKELKDNLE